MEPTSSNDAENSFFHWWPRKGTEEWVEYAFQAPATVSQTEVYWFDDETGPQKGQCRTPASWKLLYKRGNEWKETSNASGYGVEKDKFNATTFDAIETTAIRLEAKLKQNVSGGILEWRVE